MKLIAFMIGFSKFILQLWEFVNVNFWLSICNPPMNGGTKILKTLETKWYIITFYKLSIRTSFRWSHAKVAPPCRCTNKFQQYKLYKLSYAGFCGVFTVQLTKYTNKGLVNSGASKPWTHGKLCWPRLFFGYCSTN